MFYEKFKGFELPLANFRGKDASLTQEQERAEEQLILKVSFCYIMHSRQESKKCASDDKWRTKEK